MPSRPSTSPRVHDAAALTSLRRSRCLPLARSLPLLALVLATMSGCSTWDTETPFPEDYQQTYTKIHNCKQSSHPTGDHVVVWINDIGRDAFMAGQTPLPEGTVLVKSQYSDTACSILARYTAMEKGAVGSDPAAADWRWFLIDNSGGVRDCCEGGDPASKSSCVGCHAPCKSNDHVCSTPSVMP